MVNDSNQKVIEILERELEKSNLQLEKSNRQNEQLSKQIESLSEQVRQLTKLIFGSKSEKSRYQDENQPSLFDDDPFFRDSEQTEEKSQQDETSYTVVRKAKNKKRNDLLSDNVEIEEIHYHPESRSCDCCQNEMTGMGSKVVREDAEFIPARMKKIVYIEHAYECKKCKRDINKKSQVKKGKAPSAPIMRSIASPGVLAKVMYDKFALYLPLYRQVEEWKRYGLETNDKNLSNWVIRAAEDWLQPIYEVMKKIMMTRDILHVDETYGKIINRSDGKKGNTNAYNWVYKTTKHEGPVIVLFQSALTRAKCELESFILGYSGTIVCDGYSVYNEIENISFANCWAHVRRYWLKADSKLGRTGVEFCDKLYRVERHLRNATPIERLHGRWKESKEIAKEFFEWIEKVQFTGKSALAKAASYTLKRKESLMAFLCDGRIEIDNNPAENAIRPSVIGRKNWMFSVSEAGARANAICLSIAETAKANGIDMYSYLKKIFTDLPNINFHQNPEILDNYLPWSEKIQLESAK